MLAVILMSMSCVAGQKVVISKGAKAALKKAKNLSAAYENPDYAGARAALAEVFTDPIATTLASTYYEAGLVGYNQFSTANVQRQIGQTVDEDAVGAAVLESYNYWLKADEMGQVLVADKKGNMVPADPKMRKNIPSKMLEYFQRQNLITYGYSFYEKGEYMQAYDIFMKHLNIPNLEMMQDPKMQAAMVKDTTYYTFVNYAARFAYMAQDYEKSIAAFNILNSEDAKEHALLSDRIQANEFIYQCYLEQKDTVNFVRTLQENIATFPGEPWFLQNLINYYIFSNQKETAVEYLTRAIETDPMAQYYHIRGNIYEDQKQYELAFADFEKAVELDPTLADAEAGKGRVYYNQAVKINEESGYLMGAEYDKADKQMKELFRKSIPYFEKAHELEPANRDYMIVLKGLYYRFHTESGMQEKYDAIVAELNK